MTRLQSTTPGTREYYNILKTLTADALIAEWREIDEDQYWYLLECVPPIRMKDNAFMVGECLTHTQAGAIYEAVVRIGNRYFSRPAPLSSFDPAVYESGIRMMLF